MSTGKETADPSTTLRFGRDDNSVAGSSVSAEAFAGTTELSADGPAVSSPSDLTPNKSHYSSLCHPDRSEA